MFRLLYLHLYLYLHLRLCLSVKKGVYCDARASLFMNIYLPRCPGYASSKLYKCPYRMGAGLGRTGGSGRVDGRQWFQAVLLSTSCPINVSSAGGVIAIDVTLCRHQHHHRHTHVCVKYTNICICVCACVCDGMFVVHDVWQLCLPFCKFLFVFVFCSYYPNKVGTSG